MDFLNRSIKNSFREDLYVPLVEWVDENFIAEEIRKQEIKIPVTIYMVKGLPKPMPVA